MTTGLPTSGLGAVSRRRRLSDRAAAVVIVTGGLAVVAAVLGILVFILGQALPLMKDAELEAAEVVSFAGSGEVLAHAVDEYQSLLVSLDADAVVRVRSIADGSLISEQAVAEGLATPLLNGVARPLHGVLAAATADGGVVALPYRFEVDFDDEGQRQVRAIVSEASVFEFAGRSAAGAYTVSQSEDGSLMVVAQRDDFSLAVVQQITEMNLFTEELSYERVQSEFPAEQPLTVLCLDREQRRLFGGTSSGQILCWQRQGESFGEAIASPVPGERGLDELGARELDGNELGDAERGSAITAMELLIGDQSLVVGDAAGRLGVWFLLNEGSGESQRWNLERVHEFPSLDAGITALGVSPRDKVFLALDAEGSMAMEHSTTARELWRGRTRVEGSAHVVMAAKADSAFLLGMQGLESWRIDNPHPEACWQTYFGKVWYEGYASPEYVWQSTGGSQEFESKLSLVPLIFGTIKGTLFAMLLAVPLGILGALYTSQFMAAGLRRFVKPCVEVMASLPSVVLGFLAGLWLASRAEQGIGGILLAVGLALPALMVSRWLWLRLPEPFLRRSPAGLEVGWMMLTLVAVASLGFVFGDSVGGWAFGGDFQHWLRESTGLVYDQRNAMVVGLAMGFAVIPIVYTISEDAIANVPTTLISASLALGADRWQTVVRVVLPTASPGILSGVIIGFGRAVGETMIVLMAAGNTPIMDWSPFNGLRSLSANIAVEIPEAPHLGTLYRSLFLSALLLFAFTFALNMLGDLIRQRLRLRYARL